MGLKAFGKMLGAQARALISYSMSTEAINERIALRISREWVDLQLRENKSLGGFWIEKPLQEATVLALRSLALAEDGELQGVKSWRELGEVLSGAQALERPALKKMVKKFEAAGFLLDREGRDFKDLVTLDDPSTGKTTAVQALRILQQLDFALLLDQAPKLRVELGRRSVAQAVDASRQQPLAAKTKTRL